MLQGQGNERQAVTELEGYVKGGLESLHYGSIKYLPCYAAAGSRVTLGLFNDIGKVSFKRGHQTFTTKEPTCLCTVWTPLPSFQLATTCYEVTL